MYTIRSCLLPSTQRSRSAGEQISLHTDIAAAILCNINGCSSTAAVSPSAIVGSFPLRGSWCLKPSLHCTTVSPCPVQMVVVCTVTYLPGKGQALPMRLFHLGTCEQEGATGVTTHQYRAGHPCTGTGSHHGGAGLDGSPALGSMCIGSSKPQSEQALRLGICGPIACHCIYSSEVLAHPPSDMNAWAHHHQAAPSSTY